MYLGIIIAIAVFILFYFSFKGGKAIPEPEIIDEAIEDVSVSATAVDKQARENVLNRRHFVTYHIVFDCEGEPLEFAVPKELHDEISIGERDTLIYSGKQFLGFGEHGALSDADDAHEAGDGFTYDDFDESIDIELDITDDFEEAPQLSDDDREYFNKFLSRERLPSKTEAVTEETPSLERFAAQRLLEKAAIYPFIKWENGVNRMVSATYSAALNDLKCYDGDTRTGVSADSIVINKNEIRVAITINERPAPLDASITAEFGINE